MPEEGIQEEPEEVLRVTKITWRCDGTMGVDYHPTTGQASGYASYFVDQLRVRELCAKSQSYIQVSRGKEYNVFFIEFPQEATVRIFKSSKIAVVLPGI